jgi:hypothetical protein
MPHPADHCVSRWRATSLLLLVFCLGCSKERSSVANAQGDGGAALDAGPDWSSAVAAPDLRFKWVGEQIRARIGAEKDFPRTDGIFNIYQGGGAVGMLPFGFWETDPSARIAPSVDGGTNDSGMTSIATLHLLSLIEPLRTAVVELERSSLDSQLQAFAEEGMLISAVDLRADTLGYVAVGEELIGLGYGGMLTFVPRETLTHWLARAGETGHVVTAIGGDGDSVFVAAYTRDDDTRRYESKLIEADYDDLAERARSLADEGYIITAFGRDGLALMLVGTRPVGDPTKHEVLSMSLVQARQKVESNEGFAVVAWIRPASSFPNDDGGLIILQR